MCGVGYFSPSGFGPSCNACAIGYYSSLGNATTCQQCGVGETTLFAGSSSVTQCGSETGCERSVDDAGFCVAGTFSTNGSEPCSACGMNSVSFGGATMCSSCPYGQRTFGVGQTQCSRETGGGGGGVCRMCAAAVEVYASGGNAGGRLGFGNGGGVGGFQVVGSLSGVFPVSVCMEATYTIVVNGKGPISDFISPIFFKYHLSYFFHLSFLFCFVLQLVGWWVGGRVALWPVWRAGG
jgi:hypothetical protein